VAKTTEKGKNLAIDDFTQIKQIFKTIKCCLDLQIVILSHSKQSSGTINAVEIFNVSCYVQHRLSREIIQKTLLSK